MFFDLQCSNTCNALGIEGSGDCNVPRIAMFKGITLCQGLQCSGNRDVQVIARILRFKCSVDYIAQGLQCCWDCNVHGSATLRACNVPVMARCWGLQ